MTKKQLDPLSVLAMLAKLHGTTLAEEVDKYNARIRQALIYAGRKAARKRGVDKAREKRQVPGVIENISLYQITPRLYLRFLRNELEKNRRRATNIFCSSNITKYIWLRYLSFYSDITYLNLF
jgi:hypothetical protein